MRHFKPSKPYSHRTQPPKALPDRRKIAPEIIAIGGSDETATVSDTANGAMTNEELISRAKRHIGTGETSRIASFRAAADDIALACDRGAKQCEVAEGVGKSAAWVNRLLKWREGGYIGAPFADKILQGVKKEPAPLQPASTEPTSASTAPAALGENEPVESGDREYPVDTVETLDSGEAQETVKTAAAVASATKMQSTAHVSGDYHLPQELNRQDPERAFQRLTEQWPLNPFRDLLLDSPQVAQARFVLEVLLPEIGGRETLDLLPHSEVSAR